MKRVMTMARPPKATPEMALRATPALVRSGAEGAVMLPEGLSWLMTDVELVCCLPVTEPEAVVVPLVMVVEPVAARTELVSSDGLPRVSVVETTVTVGSGTPGST